MGLAPILHGRVAKRRAYGGNGFMGFLRGVQTMVPFLLIYTIFVGYNLLAAPAPRRSVGPRCRMSASM